MRALLLVLEVVCDFRGHKWGPEVSPFVIQCKRCKRKGIL
jgi:hypothetical protein